MYLKLFAVCVGKPTVNDITGTSTVAFITVGWLKAATFVTAVIPGPVTISPTCIVLLKVVKSTIVLAAPVAFSTTAVVDGKEEENSVQLIESVLPNNLKLFNK